MIVRELSAKLEALDQEIISLLWAWHRFEKRTDGPSIVDFGLTPPHKIKRISDRLDLLRRIEKTLSNSEDRLSRDRLLAHAAYVRCLMGEQRTFEEYIAVTQGLPVHYFSTEYLEQCQERLKVSLSLLGVKWGQDIKKALLSKDTLIPKKLLPRHFRKRLSAVLPRLSDYLGLNVECPVTFQFVEVDEYWGYWVDGNWRRFRMRFNHIDKGLGESECEQFLYHELLAHCCQLSVWRHKIKDGLIRKLCGTTTVHTPEQFIFEGLAQTLPPFFQANKLEKEGLFAARVRLSHLAGLVLNNIHVMINSGGTIEECITYGGRRLPTITEGRIVSECVSRSVNSLFRSYQYV
jgi:hypothetical protein